MKSRTYLFLLQTLAIRFATVDNAEAFKAAFLEARQYVLENQVCWAHKSQPSSHDLTWQCTQARRIQEEERGEADGEEAPKAEKSSKKEEEEKKEVAEVKSGGDGKEVLEDEAVTSKIANLAV